MHRAGMAIAERAIALDPGQGEAWARLGTFQSESFYHVEAMASFERALELSPNDPGVLDIVSQFYTDWGYFERARELSERAVEIDPMVAIYRNTLGWVYSYLPDTRVDAELEQFQAAIDLSPTLNWPIFNMFYRYAVEGQQARAAALVAEAARHVDPSEPWLSQHQLLVDAWERGPSAVRAVLPEISGLVKADAGFILGDRDVVIDGLQEYWDNPGRLDLNIFYTIDPEILTDERWREQVRHYRLDELWRANGFPSICRPVGENDFECGFGVVE